MLLFTPVSFRPLDMAQLGYPVLNIIPLLHDQKSLTASLVIRAVAMAGVYEGVDRQSIRQSPCAVGTSISTRDTM
jgi:hypothetical protein